MSDEAEQVPQDRPIKLLYIDDERDNLELFRLQFGKGYDLITANSAEEGLKVLEEQDGQIAVLLTDERMPGMGGVELLEKVVDRFPDMVRIIVSAYSDSERLLNAINRGRAHEYIVKPWRRKEVVECIERWVAIVQRRRELTRQAELGEALVEEIRDEYKSENIIGGDGGLEPLLGLARKVAKTDTSVFIRGETGTGKEVIARFVHEASARAQYPFVKVNCAALSESLLESELFGHEKGAFTGANSRRIGRFELAHRGTLFLDEIGDISPKLQVMLLRVLQERQFERVGGVNTIDVNVRVVAATNRHLESAVEEGSFREDLFYRLNVFPLHIPPLRDRKQDLGALLDHFLDKYAHLVSKRPKVGTGLVESLQSCDWPGNVREFENLVQRALVVCEGDVLEVDHFYFDFGPTPNSPKSGGTVRDEVKSRQHDEIKAALEKFDGNCSKAARELGMARTTLMSRAKKLGLI